VEIGRQVYLLGSWSRHFLTGLSLPLSG